MSVFVFNINMISMRIKIVTLVSILLLSLSATAQLDIKDGSFKEVSGFVNINPDSNYQYDDNNLPFAVIKVRTENINDKQRRDLRFSGNAGTFIMLEYKDGEVWVYLTAKYADYLKISHPDLSSIEFTLPYDLEPKKGYELTLINKKVVDEDILKRIEQLESMKQELDKYIQKEKTNEERTTDKEIEKKEEKHEKQETSKNAVISPQQNNKNQKNMVAQNETKVLIKTTMGDITVMLYDDTPLHRDNFIKLVNEGWYKGSPFHRVIKNFMIQGGQNADGRVDPGYRIPAEIKPNHFHKKGALAAARQADQVNPQKMSSGSQFYIVQGEVLDDVKLKRYESYLGKVFGAKERQAYMTVGGTPHLDGEYTVFGEVTEGLDIVDKIAAVKTGAMDVPVEPVTIISMEIVK